MGIDFQPVWFDSLGAKSMATFVSTPDTKIFIDPGAAEMQPGYPAPEKLKKQWKKQAKERIKKFLKSADIVVISHYHHDHYLWEEDEIILYRGKTLFVKNPNHHINQSQRERSEEFFSQLMKIFGVKKTLTDHVKLQFDPPDLHNSGSLADLYGKKFIDNGISWYKNLSAKWSEYEWIPEFEGEDLTVLFGEGRLIEIGNTRIKFTHPMFHGIEFSRTGWVFSTVVEYGGEKLLHTSDLCGPVIESYADWIILENPDYLIVDGPMTYMLGYLLSGKTLKRAVENMIRIVENTTTKVIIYDHHLLREVNYREHTQAVWHYAKSRGVNLVTAAEFLGMKPVIETVTDLSEH